MSALKKWPNSGYFLWVQLKVSSAHLCSNYLTYKGAQIVSEFDSESFHTQETPRFNDAPSSLTTRSCKHDAPVSRSVPVLEAGKFEQPGDKQTLEIEEQQSLTTVTLFYIEFILIFPFLLNFWSMYAYEYGSTQLSKVCTLLFLFTATPSDLILNPFADGFPA